MSSGSSSTGPKQDASVAHNDSIAAATPTKVESAAGTASTHESTTSTDSTKQETSSHTAAAAAASAEPTQAAPEREWGKLARQPTYNQQDVKRVQMEIYLSRNGYIPPEHKQSKDSEKFDK